ncbi:helix-turn-helix domain-containing protein [Haliea salexigens]|uniref:helix-turn-helix domain-containing protein n=1 Tax=Haliea salexigens TaxID=287487 RepID=UPI0003F9D7DD|nr:AraC family transcriptional regulator [Haliea salexigens]MAA87191.1 AraC family transcriptional regulator [Haliea sp.]|tara:strand:+ start:330 stop:1559 length:1230 start_codon:yes stop_codon:yes gene_type:complete
MFDFLPLLFLIGAAQGGFLAFALFTSAGGNRKANYYLACYLLVFVLALIDYFLDAAGLTERLVWLRTLLWPKEFLYGVFLFLYCRELTQPNRPIPPSLAVLLWLPLAIHCCASWPLLWLPAELQYKILLNESGLPPLYNAWRFMLGDFELVVTIAHLSVFIVICLRLVTQHRRRLESRYSNLDRISLDWLRNLLIGTMLVYALWLAEEIFSADLLSGREWLDVTLAVSMVVLIYTMGLLGLRQPAIFSTRSRAPVVEREAAAADVSGGSDVNAHRQQPPIEKTVDPPPQKYQRSALSPELASSLVEELEALMANKSPFLDPNLSLSNLAQALSVSTNYLSQAINDQLKLNFFDCVNGYRVRHSLPLLAQSSKTVLEIAMDSGFNSKSAFYTAFRKHQGMTPGTYRKQVA